MSARPPARAAARRPLAGGRRGAVMPLVCVLLTVIIGAAALAFDVGRLRFVAAEAQTAADAAALAAARAMQLQAATSSGSAPAAASAVGRLNRAGGGSPTVASVRPKRYSPTLAPGAAVPDASSWGTANAVEVTVTVPGRYLFARALGLTPPTVLRRSTAWIANVDAATCIMPVVLPYSALYYLGFGDPQPRAAPDVTQPQLNQISAWSPSYKTIVLVPPSANADSLHNRAVPAKKNYGKWMPANFSGTATMQKYGDWVAGRDCQDARAEARQPGVVTMPWRQNGLGNTVMHRLTQNMGAHCNFRSAGSAVCYEEPTSTVAGVRTRIVYGDFVADTATSGQPVTVRAVGELKLMCYFRASTDVCPDQPNYPGGGWYGTYFPDTGYPEGTVIGIVEAPLSVDLERTTVLGDIVTNVQRLVLVR